MKREFDFRDAVLLLFIALFMTLSGMLAIKNDNLKDELKTTKEELSISNDKVKFYEEVLTDFGIEEFIHYPELFYDEEMREQTKTHLCMWAIDDYIDMSNKYYECATELYGDDYESGEN